MDKKFSAIVTKEDTLFVAQCLELDIASQGSTEVEAITNLQEAIELHYETPTPTQLPQVFEITVKLSA
jgi:predicted RNase H-like HicB family nuclease